MGSLIFPQATFSTEKAILVVCVSIVVILIANGLIYLVIRGKRGLNFIDVFQIANRRATQTYKGEDDALQELSRRVTALTARKQNLNNDADSDGEAPRQ